MTYLIGINGKKGSGKDTACDFIREWASTRDMTVERRGFADLLKLSFARLFLPDMSRQEAIIWCDELKQDSTLSIAWSRGDRGADTVTSIYHSISGRQALQRYGTEGHREIFGDDFWVDTLLPDEDWEMNFSPTFGGFGVTPDFAVITDLRFENEASQIKRLGGQIWVIEREHHDEENPDPHPSEAPLPDYLVNRRIINNGYRLEGFRDMVNMAMQDGYDNLIEQK